MHHLHEPYDDNSNHNNITTSRLEAFSDGVMAIIITITVLELKIPHGTAWSDITNLIPLFIAYLISFQMVGTYWNNHHHLLKATDHISTGMMWANLHLLFWLSLIPFSTGWIREIFVKLAYKYKSIIHLKYYTFQGFFAIILFLVNKILCQILHKQQKLLVQRPL